MQTILLIPHNASLEAALGGTGFRVVAAASVSAGLAASGRERPGLIVCDASMPGLDGSSMIAALRNAGDWATPVIMIGAGTARARVRRLMSEGADDFLPMPLEHGELLDAVRAQLLKRRRIAEAMAAEQRKRPAAPADSTGRMVSATVLFCDVRGFTTLAERLMAGETAQLLSAWLERACRPVLGAGGRVEKFLGDGILAIFEPEAGEPPHLHAIRGLAAAVGIANAASGFDEWMRERFADRALPAFGAGVGVHSGEIMYFRLPDAGAEAETVVGDPVNVAARLDEYTKSLGWAVAASAATVGLAGGAIETGARRELPIRGREGTIEAAEVLSVQGGLPVAEPRRTLAGGLRTALAQSAHTAAQTAKSRVGAQVRSLAAGAVVQGYRVLRRIGAGSAAEVLLAQRESDGQQVALKVLRSGRQIDPAVETRFVREAELLSRIDHRHVVRVHRYAVGADSAFIEMEWVGGGTLAERIAAGLTARQALALAAQMAQGLREIHRHGIVHRDVKPANFLLRPDGTVVLADFGLAKLLAEEAALTRLGETLGTAHYLSPEQARAEPAGPRSDLYSMGVVLFEMLAGQRPYEGAGFASLVALHAGKGTPRLPQAAAMFQPLIDGLMAKRTDSRPQDADAALALIDDAWTLASTTGWSAR